VNSAESIAELRDIVQEFFLASATVPA
jgi:hypothetical protein